MAADLLRGYSIEVTARDTTAAEVCASVLRPGTEVYIAFTRASSHAAVVGIAGELRAAGLIPVPHLVARSFSNYTQFADLAARLHDAGTDAALVIGGDQDRPAGPFHSALDLLRTGVLARRGFRRIGLACYPEPHRRIDQAKLEAALFEKLDAVAADGMAPWLVSQFCLDAGPIVALAETLRARGISAPLRIGIAGPTDRRTLWKYALACGIGASIRALGTHADVLRDLLTRDTPDTLVADLATRLGARGELGIAGLHIFSFGGVAGAADWANAALAAPPVGALRSGP
jgi:methylenetetrahydrofolate reductase (NADPH)